eukprot:TRINITY_DN2643_c0_g1_i4.p1 TRINITY_DN2643_c0_g1~~TRINITY_DN2643_c0_g1_i4.p1  ORF type:complete len:712 (+),score=127.91 TRINITY_DN2643_c0_g1_i4:119-2254(+)
MAQSGASYDDEDFHSLSPGSANGKSGGFIKQTANARMMFESTEESREFESYHSDNPSSEADEEHSIAHKSNVHDSSNDSEGYSNDGDLQRSQDNLSSQRNGFKGKDSILSQPQESKSSSSSNSVSSKSSRTNHFPASHPSANPTEAILAKQKSPVMLSEVKGDNRITTPHKRISQPNSASETPQRVGRVPSDSDIPSLSSSNRSSRPSSPITPLHIPDKRITEKMTTKKASSSLRKGPVVKLQEVAEDSEYPYSPLPNLQSEALFNYYGDSRKTTSMSQKGVGENGNVGIQYRRDSVTHEIKYVNQKSEGIQVSLGNTVGLQANLDEDDIKRAYEDFGEAFMGVDIPIDDDYEMFTFEIDAKQLIVAPVVCRKPALAFQLLDFPSIIIPSITTEDEIHLGSQNMSSAFSFERGKSCLFRSKQADLICSLENAPLYVMLLDIEDKARHRLVGSVGIDLSTVIEENGAYLVSIHEEFPIGNLMGRQVATTTIDARIRSLGSAVIPHIQRLVQKTNRISAQRSHAMQENSEPKSRKEHEKAHTDVETAFGDVRLSATRSDEPLIRYSRPNHAPPMQKLGTASSMSLDQNSANSRNIDMHEQMKILQDELRELKSALLDKETQKSQRQNSQKQPLTRRTATVKKKPQSAGSATLRRGLPHSNHNLGSNHLVTPPHIPEFLGDVKESLRGHPSYAKQTFSSLAKHQFSLKYRQWNG